MNMLDKHVNDLLVLLNTLRGLYAKFGSLMDAKLAAMRTAEMDSVQSLQTQERKLTERIAERNGLRRQLMDRIAEDLDMPRSASRAMTLSGLAARMQDPLRARLLVAAGELRETVQRTEQKSEKVALVSRLMLQHMQKVFEAMAEFSENKGVYGARGETLCDRGEALFQAIG